MTTRRQVLQLGAGLGAAAFTFKFGETANAAEADFTATSGETVFFRGWQFRPDVVQSNVDKYNSIHSGHVDYATVTGDYPAQTEQTLIAGGEVDVLYANPSSAYRYVAGGWIKPASTLPNIDEITADLYDNIREAWTSSGQLMGVSYFASIRGTLQVNLRALQACGLAEADLPRTWHDLYRTVLALHEKGVKTPYLPHWFAEYFGISWSFNFEVLNRGGQIADASTHGPMLTVDGPAGETLRDWKAIWKAGVVPEEVLSYNEAAYIDAFRSGRYIFSPQQSYDIKTFNDKSQSADVAGSVTLLPATEQPWGLLDTAMYMMSARTNRSDALTADVAKFVNWYGYKNEAGEIATANRWLKENMLFSAYKSVMTSDLAREAILASVARPQDYDTILDVYSKASYPAGNWNVVWAEEFNSWLRTKLLEFLQNDLPVEQVIDDANAQITALNKQYGL